ncbi:hypothetical protein EDB84DRAFT_1470134 [Lactarius hengduanensis]|nr:hypothetical protein EDB84DRAFT_1470134 [Lactarius hengduanensis]
MSSILKRAADVDQYSNITANLYAQWKSLALTGDRCLLAIYGLVESWTPGYNLFADVWLGTNVVESSIYDGQGSFLDNLLLTSNSSDSGMPVDNLGWDTSVRVSSWNLFVAAVTPNQDQLTYLISSVYNRELKGSNDVFTPTLLGDPSPVQGAMYAPLALKAPVLITTGTPSKSHTGMTVGGVIGGVAAVLAIGTIALVAWHQRRQSHGHFVGHTCAGSSFLREVTDQGTQVTVSPFITGLALTEAAPLAAGLVHRPSFLKDSPLPLRRVVSFPVGLSSKELAQLRLNGSRSQPVDGRPSSPHLTATGRSAATSSSEARGLRSEDNFWGPEMHEIQQLPAERSESHLESLPSYATRLYSPAFLMGNMLGSS